MEDKKDYNKKIELLKFYADSGTNIRLSNLKNTKLKIQGQIDEFDEGGFFREPHIVVSGMKLFIEDIDVDSISPINIEVEEEVKDVAEGNVRKSIPKSLRMEVWERYFGDRLRGRCTCCKTQEITRDDCEMCHIVSVANGGENTVDNLRPGCKTCNRSMGTMDFDEYRRTYH